MNKNLNLGSFVLDLDNNLYGIIIESLNSDEDYKIFNTNYEILNLNRFKRVEINNFLLFDVYSSLIFEYTCNLNLYYSVDINDIKVLRKLNKIRKKIKSIYFKNYLHFNKKMKV